MNLELYRECKVPYKHFILKNCFQNETLREINKIIDTLHVNCNNKGKREDNTKRYFVDKNNIIFQGALYKSVQQLTSKDAVEFFEKLIGNTVSFKDCFLRMEIILDTSDFWLEKHTDIVEKKMSLIIYLNDNNEPLENGTDVYDESGNFVKSIPFEHNTGFLFYPSHDTWHGLEKGKQIRKRKCVLINYVTFQTDWKIRHF